MIDGCAEDYILVKHDKVYIFLGAKNAASHGPGAMIGQRTPEVTGNGK